MKIRKSKSGYYKVALARTVSAGGFDYKPGQNHVVDRTTLDVMLGEEEAVTNVLPAD